MAFTSSDHLLTSDDNTIVVTKQQEALVDLKAECYCGFYFKLPPTVRKWVKLTKWPEQPNSPTVPMVPLPPRRYLPTP